MNSTSYLAIVSLALTIGALGACSNATPSVSSVPIGTAAPGLQTIARSVPHGSALTPVASNLVVAAGFKAEIIARVPGAREISAAHNGDLLVGTQGPNVDLITNADSTTAPGAARTLITLPDAPAAGIAIGPHHALYVGTQTAVWKIHYAAGDLIESNPQRIAQLRTGPIAPGSDGDVHHSTSVAVLWNTVYASVGSSCNACREVDPGRAAILSMGLNGEHPAVYATRVRNAVAMTFNPHTFFLWAGGAGQDNLQFGHPYEYFDAITEQRVGADYGWPNCEEDRRAYTPGADCSKVVYPHIEIPAYSTIIGAVFYPLVVHGPYAFPASYRGGLFLSAHGSWHTDSFGAAAAVPQVVYVPMNVSGWDAQVPIDWSNPKAQFSSFLSGFSEPGTAPSQYTGRPTGVAVGPNGSLFVADDQTGNIYRIRPN